MVTKKSKKATIPIEECVNVATPRTYFQVQKAFQDHGCLLIDLDTGDVIHGQVSITNIGLINPQKSRTPRTWLGFVQPKTTGIKNFIGDDADAVLNPTDTPPGTPDVFILHVVDEKDTDFWTDLAYRICQQFLVKSGRKTVPTVVIAVSALCQLEDGHPEDVYVVLKKFRSSEPQDISAVSDQEIPLSDIYFDDEEEDF